MSGDVGDLIVKFSKKEYTITGLSGTDTIKNLKDAIYRQTGVLPEHQKLAGFKVKGDLKKDTSLYCVHCLHRLFVRYSLLTLSHAILFHNS